MISYKINILEALKSKGITTYTIRQNKLFGQATIQQIRDGEIVSTSTLNKLCALLECQPGDILEYTPDKKISTVSASAESADK